MFTVITHRTALTTAFGIWKTTFEDGNTENDKGVFWYPRQKLVADLHVDTGEDRIACFLGTHIDQVRPQPNRWMSVQLNISFREPKQTYGRIVKDNSGNLFLAHKGGLRGGVTDVTMTDFNGRYRGTPLASVIFPNKSKQNCHIFGPINSPILKIQLGHFVSEAERIRLLEM